MKLKLIVFVLAVIIAVAVPAWYLYLGLARTTMTTMLMDSVSRAASLYNYINEANSLERLRQLEPFAQGKEIVDVFDEELYKTDPKTVADKMQIELNVINRLYDKADVLLVTDANGVVITRNLDSTLNGTDFSNNILIRNALQGQGDQNIVPMLKGNKYYRMTTVPIRKDGVIIGTYSSAELLDSKQAKYDAADLYGETNDERGSNPLYVAYATAGELLGSSLPPELHELLRKYIADHPQAIESAINEPGKKHASEIKLGTETFYLNMALYPQIENTEKVVFMILSSKDLLLEPLMANSRYFFLIVAIIMLISIIISFVIAESFYKPVNKFMEGMIEIINGNRNFRFNNDAPGIEGSLNQNANYMISVLLGEKLPEEIKSSSESEKE